MKFDARFFQVDVSTQESHCLIIRNPDSTPVVRDSSGAVHQVMRIENNVLPVHFRPIAPEACEKTGSRLFSSDQRLEELASGVHSGVTSQL